MFIDMLLPSWLTRFKHRGTMVRCFLYLGAYLPPKSSPWPDLPLKSSPWPDLRLTDSVFTCDTHLHTQMGRKLVSTQRPPPRECIFSYIPEFWLGNWALINILITGLYFHLDRLEENDMQLWAPPHRPLLLNDFTVACSTTHCFPSEGTDSVFLTHFMFPLISWREWSFGSEPPSRTVVFLTHSCSLLPPHWTAGTEPRLARRAGAGTLRSRQFYSCQE